MRAVRKDRLWYDIAWTPHPQPALKLPEAAQPGFERFLASFSKAYGDSDMRAIGDSLDALAAELEAL